MYSALKTVLSIAFVSSVKSFGMVKFWYYNIRIFNKNTDCFLIVRSKHIISNKSSCFEMMDLSEKKLFAVFQKRNLSANLQTSRFE